ncbi:MAG: protein adenylyltransferase SelO family protein, partial [Janthinobacterium lividum]
MPLDHAGPRVPFDNTYARLPARFYARVEPTHVAAPRIVRVNHDVAALLGLDPAMLDADLLGGNRLPIGAEPIAQAYSGHQFGHFSPTLGDGRAVLLGEVVGLDGRRYDIQLKGSGPTPFSRNGDGRAALGPVLREYLIGEAMHALGIPTTRALAAVTTGELVYRETARPGAVLTRVAASHIRVGTFQFFASQGDAEGVRTLADYAIARHYPDLGGDYRGFLDAVIA